MIVELDLDPATVAQIDTLARRLGIQAVGDDRERQRRGEVIRRAVEAVYSRPELRRAFASLDDKRECSVCRRSHGPEVVHPCE